MWLILFLCISIVPGDDPSSTQVPVININVILPDGTPIAINSSSPPAEQEAHGGHGDHEAHGDHDHVEDGQLVVLMFCFSIGLGLFVEFSYTKWTFMHSLPYTVIIFLAGTLLGVYDNRFLEEDQHFTRALRHYENLTPHTFLQIFLPPLLYESASSTNLHHFRRGLWQSLTLAVPGVLINTALTGVFAKISYPFDWTWAQCLLFGSIVSATDPVAVVSLLKSLGASVRLSTLIESESLLNDGSAFVVFSIILEFVQGVEGDWLEITSKALQLSLGGVALGLAMGIISGHWIAHTFEEPNIEIAITVFTCYLTFFLAEVTCVVSGVLAVVTLGLFHVWQHPFSTSTDEHFQIVWEHYAFVMETLIFFISGVIVGFEIQIHIEDYHVGSAFLMYLILHVTRFVTIALCVPFMNLVGPEISWQDSAICIYGALRGAIGLALVLIVFHDETLSDDFRKEILMQVCILIMLTLLINATTIRFLLNHLGLADKSVAEHMSARDAKYLLEIEIEEILRDLRTDPRFAYVDWWEVIEHLPEEMDTADGECYKGLLELEENTNTGREQKTLRGLLTENEISEGELCDIVRRSCWRSFKRALHKMFSEGLVKAHHVKFLDELVDSAMDQKIMDIGMVMDGIEQQFEDDAMTIWMYNNKWFHRIGAFLLYKKHRHTIEMGYSFVEACQRAATLKMLSRFDLERANLLRQVNDEFVQLQAQVMSLVVMFHHEYPSLSQRISTDSAIRIVLRAYSKGVADLQDAGCLENSIAREIQETIVECMAHANSWRGSLRSFFTNKTEEADVLITSEHVFKNMALRNGMSEDDLLQLMSACARKTLHRGEVLIREGSKPDGVFIIGKGVLMAGNVLFVAGQAIVYNYMVDATYQISIEAYSNNCDVFHINHQQMSELMEDPDIAEWLHRMAASQFLRVLFFRENLGFDIGKIMEGRDSDYYIAENRRLSFQVASSTFLLLGRAHSITDPNEMILAPTILDAGSYVFEKGSVFFVMKLREEETMIAAQTMRRMINRQHTIASFTKSSTDFRMKSESTFGGDSMHGLDEDGERHLSMRSKQPPSSIDPENAETEMVAMRIEKFTNRQLSSWETMASKKRMSLTSLPKRRPSDKCTPRSKSLNKDRIRDMDTYGRGSRHSVFGASAANLKI